MRARTSAETIIRKIGDQLLDNDYFLDLRKAQALLEDWCAIWG